MRVMVFGKATEDSEKGVAPTAEAFASNGPGHGRTPATASAALVRTRAADVW